MSSWLSQFPGLCGRSQYESNLNSLEGNQNYWFYSRDALAVIAQSIWLFHQGNRQVAMAYFGENLVVFGIEDEAQQRAWRDYFRDKMLSKLVLKDSAEVEEYLRSFLCVEIKNGMNNGHRKVAVVKKNSKYLLIRDTLPQVAELLLGGIDEEKLDSTKKTLESKNPLERWNELCKIGAGPPGLLRDLYNRMEGASIYVQFPMIECLLLPCPGEEVTPTTTAIVTSGLHPFPPLQRNVPMVGDMGVNARTYAQVAAYGAAAASGVIASSF